MKDRKLFLFLTFLPILMSLFFWDLETNLSASSQQIDHTVEIQNFPSSIIETAQLSQFDEAGLRSQRLESPELSYTNSIKRMEMVSPEIHVQGKESSWLIESSRGEFNQTNNRISLIGDVTLTQNSNSPSTAPVKMSTEQLNYYSESQIAETNTAVVIETEGHHIESLGMRMDIVNSVFVLTERVRSTHEPM